MVQSHTVNMMTEQLREPKAVNLRVPAELLARLDTFVAVRRLEVLQDGIDPVGITRSQTIRHAIETFLDGHE